MMTPPVHDQEIDRLNELISYAVLDTPPEPDFDGITSLASHVCETPIALISLVDKGRQWFKSRIGLDVSETVRNESFCEHVIGGREVVEINDAQLDDRFRFNPLVTGLPHIRFYAGAPLVTPSGHVVGTLCVIDQVPRRLTANQKEALAELARQVVNLLEQRKTAQALAVTLVKIQEQAQVIARQQESLRHMTRMAVLGEVAGGVAHEVNNPLAVIQSCVTKLLRRCETGDMTREDVKEPLLQVRAHAHRVAKIVLGLQELADLASPSPLTCRVYAVLARIEAKYRPRCAVAHVRLIVDAPTQDILLRGAVGDVTHVLAYLLDNALYALNGAPEKWVRISVTDTADEATIAVEDSGPGVAAELRDKVMRPFFTTKPAGQGAGLGLTIAATMAESYGGRLDLDAKAEATRFTLHWPKAAEDAERMPAASSH